MEALAPWHLFIILAVIVLLFGGKKIPEVMKGLGEGVKNFKEGMNSSSSNTSAPAQPVNPPAATPTPAPTEDKR